LTPGQPRASRASGLRRLGWFVLIWAVSVLALGVVALALRVLMAAAGMKA
jgi:hypothetical protein